MNSVKIVNGCADKTGTDPGFGQGGRAASETKSCRHTSEASNLLLESRAHLRALETFGFLMLKYVSLQLLVQNRMRKWHFLLNFRNGIN